MAGDYVRTYQGTIGHVAHGKSTVVKALSGVQTVRFKNELERNITIKLGEERDTGPVVGSAHQSAMSLEEEEDFLVLEEIERSMSALVALNQNSATARSVENDTLGKKVPKKTTSSIKVGSKPERSSLNDENDPESSGSDSAFTRTKPWSKRKRSTNKVVKEESTDGQIRSTSPLSDLSSDEFLPKRRTRHSVPVERPTSPATTQRKSTLRAKSEIVYCDPSSDSDSTPSDKRPSSVTTSTEAPVPKKKPLINKALIGYKRRHKKRVSKRTSCVERKPSEKPKAEAPKPDFTVGMQEDGEYEVERVLADKVVEGHQYYLVKWIGWEEKYNTWEPVENLINSQQALVDFFHRKWTNRLLDLSVAIPQIQALAGRLNNYETEVVQTLTKEDFRDMQVDTVENLWASLLPNPRLLTSHISKQLKNKGNDALETKIRKMIARREFIRRRYEQLQDLSRWEQDLTNKLPSTRITVENNVDLEVLAPCFRFIEHCIPGEGVTIPDDPPVGCQCTTCGDNPDCCSVQSGGGFAYSEEGLINVKPGTPIYECNKTCHCGIGCANRVVQRGSGLEFCIFRTSNSTGWGVRLLQDICKGRYVCEYVGEVITSEVADKRLKTIYKGLPLYIFDLDFNDSKKFPYTVDAFQFGNISHFINHSCEPNLSVYACWIDCLDPNLPHLAMFAMRDIKAGEELTFDYAAQNCRKRKNPNQLNNDQQAQMPRKVNLGKTPCKCGSPMCRKVFF